MLKTECKTLLFHSYFHNSFSEILLNFFYPDNVNPFIANKYYNYILTSESVIQLDVKSFRPNTSFSPITATVLPLLKRSRLLSPSALSDLILIVLLGSYYFPNKGTCNKMWRFRVDSL